MKYNWYWKTEREKKKQKRKRQFKESFISRGGSVPDMKTKADWDSGTLTTGFQKEILSSVFGSVLVTHCLVTSDAKNLPAYDNKHVLSHSASEDEESREWLS